MLNMVFGLWRIFYWGALAHWMWFTLMDDSLLNLHGAPFFLAHVWWHYTFSMENLCFKELGWPLDYIITFASGLWNSPLSLLS